MKKLLLVVLVPVLVLGLVGCGKVFEGDTNPAQIQGIWFDDAGQITMSVTGNQASVFRTLTTDLGTGEQKVANNAYRTGFSGNNVTLAGTLTMEFHAFEKPGDLIGKITFTYTAATDTEPVKIVISRLDLEQKYQTYMLPPKGNYSVTN